MKHPAKFSPSILDVIRDQLAVRVAEDAIGLDPFAGVGRCHELGWWVAGNELEMPWCREHVGKGAVACGDATRLPYRSEVFDFAVTSPCPTPDQLVLTADLRWVPAGDLQVGDRLLAFDEMPQGVTAAGRSSRRRWRFAEVERSRPGKKECVRVVLENGQEVTCTYDHPWLARDPRGVTRWVEARHLKDRKYRIHRQLDTWKPASTYEQGWLAGMFDGEGSMTLGAHGAPKLQMCQADGPILDRAARLLTKYGYPHRVYQRTGTPAHRAPMSNIYIMGGFPGILRTLGELRPERLLGKLDGLHDADRCIEAEMLTVTHIEQMGEQDIQCLTTSTGTYIGDGILMHNTYGNRFADKHNARDGSTRRSYTHDLRASLNDPDYHLHPNNTGGMKWGADYWRMHGRAYDEVWRVLRDGGVFIVNVSDFVRRGEIVRVVDWHRRTLAARGFTVEQEVAVETPRMRYGANGDARAAEEKVLVCEKEPF